MSTITPEDVLSMMSIITSTSIAIITMVLNRKREVQIVNKTLDKDYFDAIFRDFLIQDMPEILRLLEFNTFPENDAAVDDIEKRIMEAYKKSVTYKYVSPVLYDKFRKLLKSLENTVFSLGDLQKSDKLREEYHLYMKKIDKIYSEIWKCITKEYRL